MIRYLENLRAGILEPQALITAETTKRSYSLKLSKLRDVENAQSAGVNSLDVDLVEGKYLLSGAIDGSIYIHNLHNFTGSPNFTARVVSKTDRTNPCAHKYSVECVQWYPFDTGMFVSSGMDKHLRVWDTNCMIPAEIYNFEGRIFQHHMSSASASNLPIVVASSVNQVILIDVRTGSSVHELRGHTSSVLTCKWSPKEEFFLATGSCDSKVLLWDVRSSKSCLKSLDQHNSTGWSSTNTGLAHDGYVNGLCFTSDGLYLLTFGTDKRLRLWTTFDGRNEMINFGKIKNDSKKCIQFDVTINASPKIVYVPSEGSIFLYNVESGEKINTLLGHYNSVNCCVYHPFYHELYSGGNDRNVLIWTADHCQSAAYDESVKSHSIQSKQPPMRRTLNARRNITADTWSSDEEG
uniref:DNA excision repair protein ERCC-8 n=2 Tax=Timema TaxID=61471 RepID=A0A7R9AM16_TIMSH|nr:unnamed protein product [Timema shepardi]CAD7568549.1 unnamed protein product [Timema californicum]